MTLALCLTILKHFWHLFAMKLRVCWLKSPENGRKLQNGKNSETDETFPKIYRFRFRCSWNLLLRGSQGEQLLTSPRSKLFCNFLLCVCFRLAVILMLRYHAGNGWLCCLCEKRFHFSEPFCDWRRSRLQFLFEWRFKSEPQIYGAPAVMTVVLACFPFSGWNWISPPTPV